MSQHRWYVWLNYDDVFNCKDGLYGVLMFSHNKYICGNIGVN